MAERINRFGINCRNVFTFGPDEWADQDGNIDPAPLPPTTVYAGEANAMDIECMERAGY